jgi:hypothetical protein
MSLKLHWEKLASADPRKGEGVLRRRLFEEGPVALFAAMRKPENLKMLQLSFRTPLASGCDLPQCKGLAVLLLREGDGAFTLEIVPKSRAYDEVYVTLCESIVSRIQAASDEQEATGLLLDELQRWQNFLESVGPEGLGAAGQQGLFGELYFLRRHVLDLGTAAASIAGWTAPGRGLHDYEWRRLVCEVKTVATKAHHKIHIPSEKQLDTAQSKVLIYCLIVTPNRSEGGTLGEAVGSVRSALLDSPTASAQFEDGLFRWGYLDVHASKYDATRYSIVRESFYEVRDGFPRLTSADIRPGIGDVGYSIALSACQPFELATIDARSLIGEGLSIV